MDESDRYSLMNGLGSEVKGHDLFLHARRVGIEQLQDIRRFLLQEVEVMVRVKDQLLWQSQSRAAAEPVP